jgi:hypothetical protein
MGEDPAKAASTKPAARGESLVNASDNQPATKRACQDEGSPGDPTLVSSLNNQPATKHKSNSYHSNIYNITCNKNSLMVLNKYLQPATKHELVK